jgi:hypothetical protein
MPGAGEREGDNHRAKVFASGIGDPSTLDYISQVVGDGEFRQVSETAGEKGRTSSTEGSTYRALAPANVVRGRPLTSGSDRAGAQIGRP